MGSYLSAPVTTKSIDQGSITHNNDDREYAVVDMQGWRQTMEDAHVVQTLQPNCQLLAVLDGHGGAQVARFCSLYLGAVFQQEWSKVQAANDNDESNVVTPRPSPATTEGITTATTTNNNNNSLFTNTTHSTIPFVGPSEYSPVAKALQETFHRLDQMMDSQYYRCVATTTTTIVL